MQEETTKKTIAISVQAATVTGEVLQNVIRSLLQRKERGIKAQKMNLRSLVKQGGKLTNTELKAESIKEFDEIAKKYHVAYSVMKGEKPEKGINNYIIFFKCDDAERMELAFRQYAAVKLSPQKEKQSIKEKLDQARKTAWKRAMEKVYIPRKEAGREL